MVANLSEQQKKFGSRLSMVNGKLMFAYLESECTLHDFKFTEEAGKMYPKSWSNVLERLEQKGVIQSYIVGKIDNVNTAGPASKAHRAQTGICPSACYACRQTRKQVPGGH